MTSISQTDTSSVVTPITDTTPTTPDTSQSDNFDAMLQKILQPDRENNVNEEELFAGLIYERISTLKGEEAGAAFLERFNSKKSEFMRPDGATRVEDAARSALKGLVQDGTLIEAEADTIHSQAFAGAQLDSNLDALYDSTGGANDPTRAVAALEQALLGARVSIENFDAGNSIAAILGVMGTKSNTVASSLAQTATVVSGANLALGDTETIDPNGTTIDGSEGFLFKPITNNQGKLAVLLPHEMTYKVLDVILRDKDGKEIESGSRMSEGIAETGREKFNFSKKGENYPNDITVEVRLADGTMRAYKIPDPSKRYD